ncbi:MAG: THUMP-like domain-containing protein [Aquirufa sp.]
MLQPEEIKFIQEHLQQDPSILALTAKKYPTLDIKKLAAQIQARQKLVDKLPTWVANPAIYFPAQISLEQASSEATALFKANLVKGKLIDITGGMGVDVWAFSQTCEKVTYVEQQTELVNRTRYNHAVLGLSNVNHEEGNGVDYISADYDWIYVDPARRDQQGNKVILFKDCQPNVLDLLSNTKRSKLLIKTSPVLDIQRAIKELEGVEKVFVVAYQQEVKELLFVKSEFNLLNPPIDLIELANERSLLFTSSMEAEKEAKMNLGDAGNYIYEVHPTILKAGFFKKIQELGVWQLGQHTHLYSANERVYDFPGKVYEKISSGPVQREWLIPHLGDLRANISTKNFPMKAEALRQKLKLKDGGQFTLFGIQNKHEKNELILCKKCP